MEDNIPSLSCDLKTLSIFCESLTALDQLLLGESLEEKLGDHSCCVAHHSASLTSRMDNVDPGILARQICLIYHGVFLDSLCFWIELV